MVSIAYIYDETFHHKVAMGLLCSSPPLYILLRRKIVAPFGKHSSSGWGPTLHPGIAWFLFECPNLIVTLITYWFRLRSQQIKGNAPVLTMASKILLYMYCGHYINRSIIYPCRIGKASQRVNLAVVSSAFAFCTINGYLQSHHYLVFHQYEEDAHKKPSFIIGFILFLSGVIINIHHDNMLRTLRNQHPPQYKIPIGGLFHYISCANFTGEIIEWFGYALASNSLVAWSFFAWVCANLIPRAISHHEYYLKKFEDYPQNRWAVIPGLV